MKEITLPATLENIEAVTAFVDEELERLGCGMKAQMQVDVAIDEIFSNIARYAYGDAVGDATVRIEKEDGLVVLTFLDTGIPYNPLVASDPDTTLSAEQRAIGGLGVFLVKNIMDDVSYAYLDGKNTLTIKKKL